MAIEMETLTSREAKASADRVHRARAGRGFALFVLLATGTILLYLDSWRALAARWGEWTFGYDHGWLIAALSAWLAWRERDALAAARPWWPGLVLVAATAAAWLVARAGDVALGQHVVLPVLLWSVALAALGPAAARALAFPLGFLYFAIPVWDFVTPFLQAATTAVSGALVAASGVPALIEGNFVTIPAGHFEIAAGCAGSAFFMTAGALAALYGHLHYGSAWARRLLLLAVAFGGAMVLNWLRVYVVIMAGHLTAMQHYLVTVDHYTFGWVLFAVALAPFYMFARRLEPAELSAARPAGAPASLPALSLAAAAGLALAAAGPLAWQRAEQAAAVPVAAMPELPAAAPGWRLEAAGSGWRPDFQSADAELGGRFVAADGGDVELWLVHYADQHQGKELVYYANRIADPAHWRIERQRRVEAAGGPANETVLVRGLDNRRVVRWWYEVGGARAAGDAEAKLRQVAARLAGRPAAGLVAYSAACDASCDAAFTRLDAFGLDMHDRLRAAPAEEPNSVGENP